MSNNTQRYIAEQKARFEAQYPVLAGRSPRNRTTADFTTIGLGTDDAKRVVTIDEFARLEHMHVIGTTGSGKSTFLLNCFLQDVARGRGAVLLDPQGSHPDSLLNNALAYLHAHGWTRSGKVHVISPNIPDYVVGFNPLAPLPDTQLSVIADALLEAFERAWGDEDTHQKPTIRSVLKATFIALAELGLNLPDAKLLFDRNDRHGLGARVIEQLQNEFAREELDRLHQLSLDPRARTDFDANVIGPINRLNEFVSSEAITAIFGMNREDALDPANTIDILKIMEKGEILLVDLQHGKAMSESDADLLGKIILRYLFLLMHHRQNLEPFFVYVDECHRYMTTDIPGILSTARKFRLGITLAHQYLSQLGKPGELIYDAVRKVTEVKAVFRLSSATEAQELAEDLIPLNLEMPVEASRRPTVVGDTIVHLRNASEAESQSAGTNTAEIISGGTSVSESAMVYWGEMQARGLVSGRGTAVSQSDASGNSTATSDVASQGTSYGVNYDPNTGVFLGPTITSVGVGSNNASAVANISSQNFQRAVSAMQSEHSAQIDTAATSQGEGRGHAVTHSQSVSRASGKSREDGRMRSQGSSEAIRSTFADLPSSFHSKENALYLAGEQIRGLPTGRCVVRWGRNATFITVPFLPRKSKP